MSDLFVLTKSQMARISPCIPLSHGVPRVDERCAHTFFSAIRLAASVIL